MPDYTELKGFTQIGDSTLTSIIQDNIIEFYDWGLLNKGNYFNITIPTSGQYGGDKHRLRLVDDPNYTKGQVWEAYRSNWVWQSGIDQADQPINISGVHVNGTFHSKTTTGTYAHHVNYPWGRVVFDSAIDTSSTVTMEYSHKWVNVTYANSVPWFRELQSRSMRIDNSHFLQDASGDWSQLAGSRFQLPAIAIEMAPRRKNTPYQLGGGQYINTDVIFHVYAEDEYTRDKLVDIISFQDDKTVYLFDTNRMTTDNRFPLDYRGAKASGALTYPDLIKPSGSPYGDGTFNAGFKPGSNSSKPDQMRFTNTRHDGQTMLNPSLYSGFVRCEAEVIMPGIQLFWCIILQLAFLDIQKDTKENFSNGQ